MGSGHFCASFLRAGKCVEQLTLAKRPQQRLVRVLSVNIDAELAASRSCVTVAG